MLFKNLHENHCTRLIETQTTSRNALERKINCFSVKCIPYILAYKPTWKLKKNFIKLGDRLIRAKI